MVSGSGSFPDIRITDGPGQEPTYVSEYQDENIHLSEKRMHKRCFGIICGELCGSFYRVCTQKMLTAKDMKDHGTRTVRKEQLGNTISVIVIPPVL